MLRQCRLLVCGFRAGRYIPGGLVPKCTAFALLGNEAPDKLILSLQQLWAIKHER
jgi:hypothetical protein